MKERVGYKLQKESAAGVHAETQTRIPHAAWSRQGGSGGRVLATKTDDLSSVPRARTVEEKEQTPASCPLASMHTVTHKHIPEHMCIRTHTLNKCDFFLKVLKHATWSQQDASGGKGT